MVCINDVSSQCDFILLLSINVDLHHYLRPSPPFPLNWVTPYISSMFYGITCIYWVKDLKKNRKIAEWWYDDFLAFTGIFGLILERKLCTH